MKVSVPEEGRPEVGLHKLGLPKVRLPKFGLPKVGLPSVGRPQFGALRTAVARLPRPGSRFEKYAWLPAGVVIAALVVVYSVFSGTIQETDATLILMGFDPDRSQLIAALVIAAMASAGVTLVVNRVGFATMLGTYGLVALFAETFVRETQNAVVATGALGAFDQGGWVLTLLTLVVIGFIAAWAGATIAAAVRPGLIASGVAVGDMVKARRPNRQLARRPIAALVVIVLLAVTGPAFGSMVNLSPDALMLQGNHQPGLVHDNAAQNFGPVEQPSATPSPTRTSTPDPAVSESPTPSPTPMTTAKPGSTPWLAWKPSGIGHLTTFDMDAPWNGGARNKSQIAIYTPPGYNAFGDMLYPVIYEAPTGITLWNDGTGVLSALDSLIDSGDMPAAIVVFIDSTGAPYSDTQCANMYDGHQWFETYISQTVPAWIDSHYKTIQDPRGRAIMGMSAGGFCAPMLALRHHDVFGVSISFSGYFSAGSAGTSAQIPFGSEANIQAHSPILEAPLVPAMDRSKMYLIIVACDGQEFYGPWAANFEKVLDANGFKYLNIDSPYTHGWPQVRYETPGVMAAWGAQLVNSGIW